MDLARGLSYNLIHVGLAGREQNQQGLRLGLRADRVQMESSGRVKMLEKK
jgi:hypothetical protein